MNFTININTKPFIIGIEKVRLHFMSISAKMHIELHKRISEKQPSLKD